MDRRGRMPYRLWYEEGEIEAIMEDELRAAGVPRVPGSVATDVDLFVERRLKIVPEYIGLPWGVQGATEFAADGAVRIQVSAALSVQAESDKSADRLLRGTLAHEAAHVLLHRTLFLKESRAMFGSLRTRQELCRDIRFTARSYTGEWWEWQANRGMAALLVPRREVLNEVERWGGEHPGKGDRALQEHLSAAFNVSREAVRHRLRQLTPKAVARPSP